MAVNNVSCHAIELANQFVQLQLHSSSLAKEALPGHFVIIEDTFPCYIMGKDTDKIQLILPPNLSHFKEKVHIKVSSLQGQAIEQPSLEKLTLLLIENDALSAAIFYFKKYRHQFKGLAFIGTNNYFPFIPCPSRQLIQGVPHGVIAAIPLLEDWKIPHRLASLQPLPGCYEGSVHELLNDWKNSETHPMAIKKIMPLLTKL